MLPFVVINPKMDYRIGDRYYLGKEQEKKEGQPLLDVILETKDSTEELPRFSPGEIMKGRLKIENTELASVRKAIIELNSIEYARWGPPRTGFDSVKKQVTYDRNKNKDIISFELQLPQNAKRSLTQTTPSSTGISKPRSILTIDVIFGLIELYESLRYNHLV